MEQSPEEKYLGRLTKAHQKAGIVSAEGVDRMLFTSHLVRVFQELSRDFNAHHRRFGWTWAGFRVMNVLWVDGELGVRELAERTSASRAAISSVVNTLKAQGMVRCRPAPNDGRLVLVQLTDAGLAEFEQAMNVQAELERGWLSRLSPEQQHELAHLLKLVTGRRDEGAGGPSLRRSSRA